MKQPVYNLDNHTPFSDGAYSIDELCAAHLACRTIKIDGIGISDHLFCTPSSREVTSERDFERLFAAETRKYVAAVHEARARWGDQLRIFCGAEINWPLNKGMLPAVRKLLDGIDYVRFEFVDWAGLTQLANQAKRFPCPVGLAHTDVAVQFPHTSMDQVVRTLANARIFYEISAHLWPLNIDAERWLRILPGHRVAVTLGTDTHDDLTCIECMSKLYETAERFGLTEKLLSPARREAQALTA